VKAKTQIKIGLIPAVIIIPLDIYCFFLIEVWPVYLGLLYFETFFFVIFAYALITKKIRLAEWIYYNWWTPQILPLVAAFIGMIYLICNGELLVAVKISLFLVFIVAPPVYFFRVGIEGLQRIITVESNVKNNDQQSKDRIEKDDQNK
jgi:hypothetical protein